MYVRLRAFLIALTLLTGSVAAAQETTGTLSGRLIDSQGLPGPGAAVNVTGPQGSRTVTSDSTGRFSVPFLVPGTYSIRSELQGFKAVEQKDLIVRLGQTTDISLTMEVGGLTETVEVTGSSPTIDTETTTI